MRLYLDNCCFNRPYDDQSSLTIRLETEAKLDIQDKIKAGIFSLGWSYILDFEKSANPFFEKKTEIQHWKEVADAFAEESPAILADMNSFISVGLKPADALHIACAVALQCPYFLTVDKRILKTSSAISTIQIMHPIDFMIQWEIRDEN